MIRIVDKTNTEDWQPYTQEITKTALPREEDQFISQLTMDSHRLEEDEDLQFSQDSIQADEAIHKIPDIQDEKIKEREDTDERNNEREVNVSHDVSLNDTPGKDLVAQLIQYNIKINQDSRDYGASPRQEQHDETSQYQDSDEDYDE